ncbi:DUF2075 domain-containing protein [Turicibacter sanguinis]|uniref:DUF2075 domain-containing protein n=2 Tax=Turicibacter sanguinis TaxID=154288 RepID=A0A6I3N8B1_9FIRM|nr:DUF2075 domain-containing protein [Turicibacter sanguinis]MTK68833.1 DUF2075 domain-containing protein [Turicibacter sanguinis]MTK79923.1 DUF2075 domain-containing protein [Turicibacter sanguinis]MTK83866.1 DUF2075 domain-containing protein [Turicibacter sanguinis]MTK87216.1 DUF2075 domain-containing protein [Turicibacter sanguinis]MTK93708.1 DUF2075 domain-containing protein [Turicibacter sanguinis]
MIVYEATKSEFLNHILNDELTMKIYENYQKKIGRTSKNEIRSWDNSMQYMYKVLSTDDIPSEAGVAIEYKVPTTSKRIDFILTGMDEQKNDSVVIVELKQWESSELVEMKDGIIKTRFAHGVTETAHPSYQAWSYASLIENYNESVQNGEVSLYPCAYLHNYVLEENDALINEHYQDYIDRAPVYVKGDVLKLRSFIQKYIKLSDRKRILYKIENGKIRPSKSLQDSLNSMLQGNQEFIMIDTQKVVYEEALELARDSYRSNKKNVLIVEGGPGTGKSVLAINLLVKLTSEEMVSQYITKNSAPRSIYCEKLQGNHKKSYINNLFKGSGCYYESDKNEFDVLIVDEAHRLNEKSGMFKNKGENQTKEIINAAKFSIFFIDENQRVTVSDAGSKEAIRFFAGQLNADVYEMKLDSQFRCNGADGYLSWLDDVLEIKQTANFDGFEFDYDIKVVDDPNVMRDLIEKKNVINNKARIVAGYCWEWKKDGRNNTNHKDIEIKEHHFGVSWNLGNSSTWAIDPTSVKEAGCIHTCQGLEFDYVGVIIGDDMRYENGQVVTDFFKRASTDQSIKGLKGMYKKNPEEALELADKIIKNTYRTLMTRGQKGCYIYCTDHNLSIYLKKRLNQTDKVIRYIPVADTYGWSMAAEDELE